MNLNKKVLKELGWISSNGLGFEKGDFKLHWYTRIKGYLLYKKPIMDEAEEVWTILDLK